MGMAGVAETRVSAKEPAPVANHRERRIAPRFLCDGRADVLVLGGALRFPGRLRNLSLTGCCLLTDEVFPLERGTQVEVVIVVDKVQFRVAAGVRSTCRARGVGLEFIGLSARCVRYLQTLIAELEDKRC